MRAVPIRSQLYFGFFEGPITTPKISIHIGTVDFLISMTMLQLKLRYGGFLSNFNYSHK